MKLVTVSQMQTLDRQTIQLDRIPQKTLMNRAGRVVAEAARSLLHKRSRVVVLAGPGNNGGDAIIAGNILKRMGHTVRNWELPSETDRPVSLENADLVIDGLLGTGLSRPVRGEFRDAIAHLNSEKQIRPGLAVVSVDIPSGLHGDSGKPMDCAVQADLTVTFGLPKRGLVQQPALDHVGRLIVADIGFRPSRVASIKSSADYFCALDASRLMPRRSSASYKNTFGHVLVIAGSEGFHGAAWMTAHGALAAGAGLVTLAVPRGIYAAVASQCRQVMVVPAGGASEAHFTLDGLHDILPLLAKKTAFAIGPGIGTSRETMSFLKKLFPLLKVPSVLDADALNLVSLASGLLSSLRAPRILTPHPGEMARLTRLKSASIQSDRLEAAGKFSKKCKSTVVLKGARTVVAGPSGKVSVNSSGNSSLAVGGSGDVLTGMIAGFAAQGLEPADATRLAVYLHGTAAESACPEPVTAGVRIEKLLREIPRVMRSLLK